MFVFVETCLQTSAGRRSTGHTGDRLVTFTGSRNRGVTTFCIRGRSKTVLIQPGLVRLVRSTRGNSIVLIRRVSHLTHLGRTS